MKNRQKRAIDNSSRFDFSDDEFADLDNIGKTVHKRPFNPSVDLDPAIYCSIINNLPMGCLQQNMMELWLFDEVKAGLLNKEDILRKLNTTSVSPFSGHESNFVNLLGGVQRNSTGHIVSAKTIMSYWMVYVNFSNVDHDITGNMAGTEDWVNYETQFGKI